MERKTFDVAAEPDPVHDDREQVRHDDEQAHGEQKRHDEGKDKLPVLEFLSGPFRAALGGKVQCLDAVDEGFYQRGETAQERFLSSSLRVRLNHGRFSTLMLPSAVRTASA